MLTHSNFTVYLINHVESTAQNGSVHFNDDATIQCVPIPITSVSPSEEEECFTFNMSSVTSVSGLTLDPAQATVCVFPIEGEHWLHLCMYRKCVCMVHHLSTCAEAPVSIGVQRSLYSVEEGNGSVEICTEVTSGSIAGHTIHIDYTTVDGMAVGKHEVELT